MRKLIGLRWFESFVPKTIKENAMNSGPIALFSLESDADFASAVARYLDLEAGAHEERDFGNGEHKIRPLESMRDSRGW